MGQARRRRSSGGVCCVGARNFSIRRNRKSDFQAGKTAATALGGVRIHRKVAPNGRKASLRLPQPTPPCQAGPVTSCAALRRAAFPFRADLQPGPPRPLLETAFLDRRRLRASRLPATPVERLLRRSRKHRPASSSGPHCCSPSSETAPRGYPPSRAFARSFGAARLKSRLSDRLTLSVSTSSCGREMMLELRAERKPSSSGVGLPGISGTMCRLLWRRRATRGPGRTAPGRARHRTRGPATCHGDRLHKALCRS